MKARAVVLLPAGRLAGRLPNGTAPEAILLLAPARRRLPPRGGALRALHGVAGAALGPPLIGLAAAPWPVVLTSLSSSRPSVGSGSQGLRASTDRSPRTAPPSHTPSPPPQAWSRR